MPTPRKLTRALLLTLAALAIAATALVLTYALRPRPHIPDADDEVVIGPDWHKPAHPWSQVEEAQRSAARSGGSRPAVKRTGSGATT
jgi:hypothetical protein